MRQNVRFRVHQGLIILFFKGTVCTADPLQVELGPENGDFNFNAFAFNQNDQSMQIVCDFQLCLASDNCFQRNDDVDVGDEAEVVDDDCGENYSKQEVIQTTTEVTTTASTTTTTTQEKIDK